MASLREFKVMVRKNSDKTIDYLIVKYKRIMNDFQNRDENKNDDGSYVFIWYAHIYDLRTLKEYIVFCDYATKLYDIEDSYMTNGGRVIKGVMYLSKILDEVGSIKRNQNQGTL